MSTPIITTKLYAPLLRPQGILRERLIERLEFGLQQDHKLTLVSAPAGFGKTTIVSSWTRQVERPVAWISLDEADNDPVRILTYVIAALQLFEPGFGEQILSELQSVQKLATDSILTDLINDIAHIPTAFMLVFDDYHLIRNQAIHNALEFIIEKLPAPMHLVLLSRSDPPLALSRYRVRDQITEIREVDLRFSTAETAAFLNQVMELALTDEQVETLNSRTEGWIAGLQLAALSMRGRENVADFIAAFSGSHRFVIDYLAYEVLRQQDEGIQAFLFQTAFLDSFTPDLCDFVTGRSDSQSILTHLERANLFLIPQDDHRLWYRYHRLFADFLRVQPETIQTAPTLHARAAQWFENQNHWPEAVRHILAAGDIFEASRVVGIAAEQARKEGLYTTVMGWLDQLPDNVIRNDYRLAASKAHILLIAGELGSAAGYIDSAEDVLQPNQPEAYFEIMQLRASLALSTGNFTEAARLVDQIAADPKIDASRRRCSAQIFQGDIYCLAGNIKAASQSLQEAIQSGQEQCTENEFLDMVVPARLALLWYLQGKRQQALALNQRVLQEFIYNQTNPLPLAGFSLLVQGILHYAANELDLAYQYLKDGLMLCQPQTTADLVCTLGTITMVRLQWERGENKNAEETIASLKRIVLQWDPPDFTTFAIVSEVNFYLQRGDLAAAQHLHQTIAAAYDTLPAIVQAAEQLVRVRLELAQNNPAKAAAYLLDMEQAAQENEYILNLITIYILQAQTHIALDREEKALVYLQRAINLAAPEGYKRVFLEEDSCITQLLVKIRRTAPEFIDALLEDWDSLSASMTPTPLIDSVSEHELKVLRLIAAGLSNPEVATELYLSVNTVKWHLKNIYNKLHVRNRLEAVERARELRLL